MERGNHFRASALCLFTVIGGVGLSGNRKDFAGTGVLRAAPADSLTPVEDPNLYPVPASHERSDTAVQGTRRRNRDPLPGMALDADFGGIARTIRAAANPYGPGDETQPWNTS